MNLEFIALDYDYLSINNQTYLKIFGRTKEGKTCCLIDEPINYFYTLVDEKSMLDPLSNEIRGIEGVSKIEMVDKKFLGEKVKAIKVYCDYKDRRGVTKKIKEDREKEENNKIHFKERDIPIVTKYIINHKVKPLSWHQVEGEVLNNEDLSGLPETVDTDFVIKVGEIKKAKKQEDFEPRVLAFDIEAEEFDIGKGKILMISLASDNFKKVLTWKKCSSEDYVECFKDEEEMLQKFNEYVDEINPDILTGYFSDGFDLPYIRARAREHNLQLTLGEGEGRILFSKGRPKKARINGLLHIDLFKFIDTVYSPYMQSETLSLDDVASELLGEGKVEIDHMDKKTEDLKEEEWQKFFEYNLQDSLLTYKLFQEAWQDMLEFTRVIQEPLFKTTRYSMSHLVENYFIHNLDRFNEIAERRPKHEEIKERKQRRRYEGGYVLQPEADLYENLAMFDFSSMFPTIIVSFNLSRETLLNGPSKNAYHIKIDEDEELYFSKQKGFIPSLLEELIRLRRKYKKELKKKPDPIKKARSNAFKLLANASYGYHGFFGARWYCPEAAAATTSLARKHIKETMEKTREEDYKVIYSDTDGYAFQLGEHSKKDTQKLLKKLNKNLPGIMELELEGYFKRGIWVTKRSGKFGAKKKYALIDYEGNLKIRGFETVRRDWCNLAREIQNNVLEKILKNGNEKKALKYVRKMVKKIKNRKIDRKKLIIRTQLKKSLDEYKNKTPHTVVARKMKEKELPVGEGSLISYYIAKTRKKDALVRERAKLPEEEGKYDINYYLQKQILPAVENIFQVFNITKDEILEGKKQTKLGNF